MVTAVVTTNYYLGDRLIATRSGSTLTYVHQDALTGTSVTTNSSGTSTGSIKYLSFGDCRNSSGNLPEQKFTGQRLDSTGLYYYGARYYDPTIGRFISADTIVPNPANPQSLNRYSYCLNNPLKYTDPSGHDQIITSLGDDKYAICDGSGKLLAVATGLDDLANKMDALSAVSREVSLPSAASGESIVSYLPTQKEGVYTKTEYNWSDGKLQSTLDPYLYTYNPYDTYFPFRQGNKWEGRWNRYYSGNEIDWGGIGQKFRDAEWDRIGDAFVGTGEILGGTILTVLGGGFGLAATLPGAANGIPPQNVLNVYTYFGISLFVDGCNTAAGYQILDVNWMPYPLY